MKPFRMLAHDALDELECFLQLSWELPFEVIDTLAETRNLRGQVPPNNQSWHWADVAQELGVTTKHETHLNQNELPRDPSEIPQEVEDIAIKMCKEEVKGCAKIWGQIKRYVDINKAHARGRYLLALARIQRRGLSTDRELTTLLETNIASITSAVADEFDPMAIDQHGRLSSEAWSKWCKTKGIAWPANMDPHDTLFATGELERLACTHPELRALIHVLHHGNDGKQSRFNLPIGRDGKLRCSTNPFTSDCMDPKVISDQQLFGASPLMQSVLIAAEDRRLLYFTYEYHKLAVAAALSEDGALIKDCETGDPYWAFAMRRDPSLPPANMYTKEASHRLIKNALLAILHGHGAELVALHLGRSEHEAQNFIDHHKKEYSKYWSWRDELLSVAAGNGGASSLGGWNRSPKPNDCIDSIANCIIEASGAELIQKTVCDLEDAGYSPVGLLPNGVIIETKCAKHMNDMESFEELFTCKNMMSGIASVATGISQQEIWFHIVSAGTNHVNEVASELWQIATPIIGRELTTEEG